MNWRKVLFFTTIGGPVYLVGKTGQFIGDLIHWNETPEERAQRHADEY